MEVLLYIGLGAIIGVVIGWLYAKLKMNVNSLSDRDDAQQKINQLERNYINQLSTVTANLNTASQTIVDKNKEIESIKDELKSLSRDLTQSNQLLATANANNEALKDKLETQKKEIKELGEKFNTEFENIANRILETKTEKFTELNKNNLKAILEPLGKNITEFKSKVEEVYDKESKERFSLGEKVILTSFVGVKINPLITSSVLENFLP